MTRLLAADPASGWLIASDIDHTLIQSPSELARAGCHIRSLAAQGVPVILASSKTFTEMAALHQAAGIGPAPFVFENGCGIGWPGDRIPARTAAEPVAVEGGYAGFLLAQAAAGTRELLIRMRAERQLEFVLLDEMTTAELSALTGLDAASAARAQERLATVPILWRDLAPRLEALRAELRGMGLGAVAGGRFVHIAPPSDKAEALVQVRAWLGAAAQQARLLACGDSDNDRALLESADLALVFQNPGGTELMLARPAIRVSGAGPDRWLRAVLDALPVMTTRLRGIS